MAGSKAKITDARISMLDLLTKVASIVVLIYGFLFFLGWVYLVCYFGSFGLDLYALDIPIYNFPSFSIVLLQPLLPLFAVLEVVLLLTLPFFAIRSLPRPTSRRWIAWMQWRLDRLAQEARDLYGAQGRFLLAVILGAAILLLILTCGILGQKAAQQTWGQAQHVRLFFKIGDKQGFDPVLLRANNSGRLSLLAQTKDLVVVFEGRSRESPNGSVFVLARADVSSVQILIKPPQSKLK